MDSLWEMIGEPGKWPEISTAGQGFLKSRAGLAQKNHLGPPEEKGLCASFPGKERHTNFFGGTWGSRRVSQTSHFGPEKVFFLFLPLFSATHQLSKQPCSPPLSLSCTAHANGVVLSDRHVSAFHAKPPFWETLLRTLLKTPLAKLNKSPSENPS